MADEQKEFLEMCFKEYVAEARRKEKEGWWYINVPLNRDELKYIYRLIKEKERG